MIEDKKRDLKKAQDKLYQSEHVTDYLDLCTGGSPITTLEIDEETYDVIGKLSEHYHLTRRQTLSKIINNWYEENKDKPEFKELKGIAKCQ